MSKLSMNTIVVSFDTKPVTSSDKLTVKVSAVAGFPLEQVEKFKGGAGMISRVENISHGMCNMFHTLHAESFATFHDGVAKEAKNNSSLFDRIKPGDVSLTFSRTSGGQPVGISTIDLRGALDFLKSISVAGTAEVSAEVISEEFSFEVAEKAPEVKEVK